MIQSWWKAPEVLARWTRDALISEMAALRPGGWAWPGEHGGDVHLLHDAHADSLELMALHSAWAEQLDLRDEALLQRMMDRPSWKSWTAVALARLEESDTLMRFATSGSTGRAQRLVHTMPDLDAEVQCIAARLRQGGPAIQRIVSAVRSNHIYGFLFSILLPSALGGRPVVDAAGLPPALVLRSLRAGDLVVAFPDWWALATRSQGTPAWASGLTGVSSTAPCPPDVAQAAIAQGLTRWIEVYGSTETAGVGWREHPEDPFELQPYWNVVHPAGGPASTSTAGCEEVHDESLLQRRTEPAAGGDRRIPIPPPDHLCWTGERHFRPVARRDGVVQVGGTNVSPAWVAEQLLKHPAIAEAAVRPCAVGSGLRLKAFVVLKPSTSGQTTDSLMNEIIAWCRQRLAPAARPTAIRFGPALPRNEMGKLCDWDL